MPKNVSTFDSSIQNRFTVIVHLISVKLGTVNGCTVCKVEAIGNIMKIYFYRCENRADCSVINI